MLALIVGGASGVVAFIHATFSASTQRLVSLSAWGVPELLFSRTNLAQPVTISTPLRVSATVILVAGIIGLIVISLRQRQVSPLTMWNVTACAILLLPVTHPLYTLYFLPLLWVWVGRILTRTELAREVTIATGVLVVWWLAVSHWTVPASSSSVHVIVPFIANIVALTISVVCEYRYSSRVAAHASDDVAALRPLGLTAEGT